MSKVFKHSNVNLDSEISLSGSSTVTSVPTVETTDEKEDSINIFSRPLQDQAKQEGYQIIKEARAYAEKIISNAQIEAANLKETAKEEGYNQGLEQARTELKTQCDDIVGELQEIVQSLDANVNDILNSNNQLIKDLSIEIAKKIINTELDRDETAFLNLYKAAVSDCISNEWVKLSVSEYEYEFATLSRELLISLVKGAKYIDVIKVDNAPKGTCIVETSSGISDSSAMVQLNKVYEALTKAEIQNN